MAANRDLEQFRLKLLALKRGNQFAILGEIIDVRFPPGLIGDALDPRAEAAIRAFADSCACDFEYQASRRNLTFQKR